MLLQFIYNYQIIYYRNNYIYICCRSFIYLLNVLSPYIMPTKCLIRKFDTNFFVLNTCGTYKCRRVFCQIYSLI